MDYKRSLLINSIFNEVDNAKKKHPNYPDHVVARAAIVCEEAGELIRETLIWKYEKPDTSESQKEILDNIKKEAIQVAAAAIRFLENLSDIQVKNKIEDQNGIEQNS